MQFSQVWVEPMFDSIFKFIRQVDRKDENQWNVTELSACCVFLSLTVIVLKIDQEFYWTKKSVRHRFIIHHSVEISIDVVRTHVVLNDLRVIFTTCLFSNSSKNKGKSKRIDIKSESHEKNGIDNNIAPSTSYKIFSYSKLLEIMK